MKWWLSCHFRQRKLVLSAQSLSLCSRHLVSNWASAVSDFGQPEVLLLREPILPSIGSYLPFFHYSPTPICCVVLQESLRTSKMVPCTRDCVGSGPLRSRQQNRIRYMRFIEGKWGRSGSWLGEHSDCRFSVLEREKGARLGRRVSEYTTVLGSFGKASGESCLLRNVPSVCPCCALSLAENSL